MPFRDDRDALRAQRDVLEAEKRRLETELDEKTRALAAREERDQDEEDEIARLKKEVAQLEARLDPQRQARRRGWLIVGAVLIVLGAGALTASFSAPAPEPHVEPVRVAPEPPQPVENPVYVPPVAREHPVRGVALFGAVVEESTVDSPAAGDGCMLAVTLRDGPTAYRTRVRCQEELADADATTFEVAERSVSDGWEYAVEGTGTDSVTGRVVVVDTATGLLTVSVEDDARVEPDDDYRVRLRVQRVSVPRFGDPLHRSEDAAFPDVEPAETEHVALEGGWQGELVDTDAVTHALRVGPTTTASTIVMRSGKTVRRTRTDGPMTLVSPESGAHHEVEIAADRRRGTAVITTADGTRYEGRFGPGAVTFQGRVIEGGAPSAHFWLRRMSAPELARDPHPVDLGDLSPGVQAAVREALENALAPPTDP
jgi:hypothetical protein